MKPTLTRAEVVGAAYRVLADWRGQKLEYTVPVCADPALTITEVLAAGLAESTYQVVLRRESSTDHWQLVSITPEPEPNTHAFNVTFCYPPALKQLYGYSLRATDKQAARREFKRLHPGAKIIRLQDWYEF